MPFSFPQEQWKNYQRFSDGVKLRGQLVEIGKRKFILVQEKLGEIVRCPHCKELLEHNNQRRSREYLLETAVFHQRHRLIDKEKKAVDTE